LQEPGLFFDLQRPADELVDGSFLASARNAVDVEAINAQRLLATPLKAAEAYREKALLHNQTAEGCQAQGSSYEP